MGDMSSAQIRQAMQMTVDLAPAIGRAAEIVEAAEKAERLMAELRANKQAAEKDITSLHDAAKALRADVGKVSAELEQDKRDAATAKAELNKKLGAIQEKVEAANRALEATREQHAEFMQAAEAEKILRQSELDGVKREMEAVLNKLRG